jgi:hypothetical protein
VDDLKRFDGPATPGRAIGYSSGKLIRRTAATVAAHAPATGQRIGAIAGGCAHDRFNTSKQCDCGKLAGVIADGSGNDQGIAWFEFRKRGCGLLLNDAVDVHATTPAADAAHASARPAGATAAAATRRAALSLRTQRHIIATRCTSGSTTTRSTARCFTLRRAATSSTSPTHLLVRRVQLACNR